MSTLITTNSNINNEPDDFNISQCMTFISGKLSIMQIEEKNKKKESEDIKHQIKALKMEYNSLIKQFQSLYLKIITHEKALELSFLKVAKLTQLKLQSINKINESFYLHLLDISNSFQKEFNYLLTLIFIDPSHSFTDIITIFRDKTGLKMILEDIEKSYKRLYDTNNDKYQQFKNIIKETEHIQKQFPFDFLFEYLDNCMKIIELKDIITIKRNDIEKEIETKNALFIKLKHIERNIKIKETQLKSVYKKQKKLLKLIDIFTEIENQCNIENTNEQLTNTNSTLIDKIKQSLSQLKDIDITPNSNITQSINQNLDTISSLTIQSEYTQSDMVVILGNNITKSKHLNHNGNSNSNNNSKQQLHSQRQLNTSNNKNDDNSFYSHNYFDSNSKCINDNNSICDEMIETNDRHKITNNKYIQKINIKQNDNNINNNSLQMNPIKKRDIDIIEDYEHIQMMNILKHKKCDTKNILILEKNDEHNTCCSTGCSYSTI